MSWCGGGVACSTVAELLPQAAAALAAVGIDEARLEAELLLGFCLGIGRTELYLAARETVDDQRQRHFSALLRRRLNREPLAYITGEKEFWSLPFFVTPAVLIPRPETEFLLEMALARRNFACRSGQWLDLCCGSGVIGVVLAREARRVVTAVDISAAALAVARVNCRRHGVLDRVALVQGDLVTCLRQRRLFSLIVANPPYIRRDDVDHRLEPEVARFEPRLALDGGASGMEVITAIASALPDLLAPGGDCFMEIGEEQGNAVRTLFARARPTIGYRFVEILKDYAGRDRVVHIRAA
ncbi:MAG: peptide chain release factor N(5)-glutamine methyltransferase [Desulfofustis sp.]|jgi:release factor glutamine methyltransferase|nr:peptide chain release factor N(5)-glutamine methyltransferase [Desulfofustis sp.]